MQLTFKKVFIAVASFFIVVSAILSWIGATFIRTNTHEHPLAAISQEYQIPPQCLDWLQYPDYPAVLGLPHLASQLPGLQPPLGVTHRYYKRTRRCWHPDKRAQYPHLSNQTSDNIVALVEDAIFKVSAHGKVSWYVPEWAMTPVEEALGIQNMYTAQMPDTMHWKTHLPMPVVLRSLSPCTSNCTLRLALINRFLTPYWRAETQCLPCTMQKAVPWLAYVKPRVRPLEFWDPTLLPPRLIHDFWYSKELSDAAEQSWGWALLRHWGTESSILRIFTGPAKRRLLEYYTRREIMPTSERIRIIKEGWMRKAKFVDGDKTWREFPEEIVTFDFQTAREHVAKVLLHSSLPNQTFVTPRWKKWAEARH